MSAIPALPESVLNKKTNGPQEALKNGVETSGVNSVHRHTTTEGPEEVSKTFRDHDLISRPREFSISEAPIENPRKIKIIIIGAGASGIYCGIRIPERLRNVDLVIYDKNSGMGGTWHENKYPGCACDIPSPSYTYSFESNTQWSALYASSAEIEAYFVRTAKKYSVDRFVKLRHQVEECRWDATEGKWHVRVKDLVNDRSFQDTADILVSARGGLNNISWPEIPGLEKFGGKLMHSAMWDRNYDCSNKKIGVIGNGSSGIQIVPNIQKLPGVQLTTFARSPTWISPSFGTPSLWTKVGINGTEINEQTRAKFANDPEYYHKWRLEVEEDQVMVHDATLLGTPMQVEGKKLFEENMRTKLASKPQILETLLPQFPPGCRRLTPGPGYLESLTKDNVSFVKDDITAIEPTGVRTADGKLHEVDLLICATGFNTSFQPPFGVSGRNGKSLKDHWQEYPRSYLSCATDEFPNAFFMLGPNAAIGAGSLILMMEATGDYIVKCARKLQKENIKSMTVRTERVDDFVEYAEEYFKRTVYATQCKSWYKNKSGKVSGLWPGSTLQYLEAVRSPRWEDFEYEYPTDDNGAGTSRNQLAWLGNGWSINMLENHDLAWFLYPEFLDVPAQPPEATEHYKKRMFSH